MQVLPQAHLNLNQFVSSYSQQDGVVTIRTSTGKLIEGDALIGADGVRSAVPPHVGVGTRVVVMTADGSYVERAKD